MDLKQLTELNAVSGHEQQMRRTLLAALSHCGAKVTMDRMGNVVAEKKGTGLQPKRIMVTAHMDEVGLIVNGHTEEGFLRIAPVGNVDPRMIISKRVLVGDDLLPGIIGAIAIHLQTAEDRKRVLSYREIYVDIGAKKKEEAEKKAPLGTYIAFDAPYVSFGEDRACGKALDSRTGVWNLLRLLEKDYANDLVAVFTSQKEVGYRGAKGASFAAEPAIGLVLDGTEPNDLGMTEDVEQCCKMGEGVVVSFMDQASIGDRKLFKQALQAAEAGQISCQVRQSAAGGNESGTVQRAREGIPTLVLSVPCRYMHSPSAVVKLSDVDAQLALTETFLMQL